MIYVLTKSYYNYDDYRHENVIASTDKSKLEAELERQVAAQKEEIDFTKQLVRFRAKYWEENWYNSKDRAIPRILEVTKEYEKHAKKFCEAFGKDFEEFRSCDTAEYEFEIEEVETL